MAILCVLSFYAALSPEATTTTTTTTLTYLSLHAHYEISVNHFSNLAIMLLAFSNT